MNSKYFGLIILAVIIVTGIIWLISNSGLKEENLKSGEVSQVKQAQTKQEPIFKDINAQETNNLIQNNKDNENLIVIDVRASSEYSSGYIESSINLDYNSLDFKNNLNKFDKNKAYIVYCRSGSRSNKALSTMKELGFNEVYNLLGGITEWSAQGLPVVK